MASSVVANQTDRRAGLPHPRAKLDQTTRSVPYPARVIVVDAHDIPRAGLRGVLAGQPEFEVVTEATDGQQAVALCRRLRPDVALMEIDLPGLDGLTAAQAIRRDSPETHVVIVTDRDDTVSMKLAVEAGVAAYLRKTASEGDVLSTLRRVLAGDLVLDHEVATRALHHLVDAPSWTGASLTAREHEVLRLVSTGKTNQEIGMALGVSTRTAKAHVERIIARLAVANRAEAVARAIGLGILEAPGVR